jgi:hypothetical protein
MCKLASSYSVLSRKRLFVEHQALEVKKSTLRFVYQEPEGSPRGYAQRRLRQRKSVCIEEKKRKQKEELGWQTVAHQWLRFVFAWLKSYV